MADYTVQEPNYVIWLQWSYTPVAHLAEGEGRTAARSPAVIFQGLAVVQRGIEV